MNGMVYSGLALALAGSALNVVGSFGFGLFVFSLLNLNLVFALMAFVGCVVALGGIALQLQKARADPAEVA